MEAERMSNGPSAHWRSALYELFRPTLRQLFRGWILAVYRWRTCFLQLGEREEHCRLCRIPFVSERCDVFCPLCVEAAIECDDCEYYSHSVRHYNGEKFCDHCNPDRDSDNDDDASE